MTTSINVAHLGTHICPTINNTGANARTVNKLNEKTILGFEITQLRKTTKEIALPASISFHYCDWLSLILIFSNSSQQPFTNFYKLRLFKQITSNIYFPTLGSDHTRSVPTYSIYSVCNFIVCNPPPFCRGRRVESPTNFQKGGLGKTSTFRGCWERGGDFFSGEGLQFLHKKQIKAKIFFKTKNLNWEMLPKNLVTFKR